MKAVAVLIHLAVSTLTAMVLGIIIGQENLFTAVASLGTGTICSILFVLSEKGEERVFPKIRFLPALFYCFIGFAGLQHFLYLLYYDQHALKTLHANNFGDLSMHIQYIRFLASGAHFWPDNPGYAGELLRYPFGMDLYNALWEILGVPLDSHLFMIGFIMTLVTIVLLHRWMGWLGVGAFFLNGGLANWQSIWEGRLYDFQNALAWKSFFLSLWITQRGLLFAIPAGVYLLKVTSDVLLGERSLHTREKIICVVLWSALAWFHIYTYIIISLIVGICTLIYKKVREMSTILVPVALIGLIFIWFSTEGFSKVSIVHLQWRWVAGDENLLKFWLMNLGPWIILGVITIFSLFKKSNKTVRPIALVAFVLFIVFTWLMVAPWDWDNIKVLLWLYLLIVWLTWRTWVKDLSPVIAFFVGCILFFSGALSVVSSLPGTGKGVELYRAADLWEAETALMDIPEDSVLAVVPDPNHPAMFWGAAVTMRYPGHLWSHGIDYTERERLLDDIYKGKEDWFSSAKKIGVTHIYWGEHEKGKYSSFNPPWLCQLKNVSRSPEIAVYDVQGYKDE
jgi:hypothetical protein